MRLDLSGDSGDSVVGVVVTLSRRNLLTLLAKVSDPFSARMLASGNAYRDGEEIDDINLIVRCEPDETHHADRLPPGPMRPAIEAVIQQLGGDGGERN